jgi:hypothetical protein
MNLPILAFMTTAMATMQTTMALAMLTDLGMAERTEPTVGVGVSEELIVMREREE